MMLSVLIISMFLMGCTEQAGDTIEVEDEDGNLVGEASRLSFGRVQMRDTLRTPKLECDVLEMGDLTHKYCRSEGYDVCVSATVMGKARYEGREDLYAFPWDCETPYSKDLMEGILGTDDFSDNARTTCCKIS